MKNLFNRSTLIALLIVSANLLTLAQTANRSQIDERNVRAAMNFLASDAMQGRGSGTQFERIAAEYISSRYDAVDQRHDQADHVARQFRFQADVGRGEETVDLLRGPVPQNRERYKAEKSHHGYPHRVHVHIRVERPRRRAEDADDQRQHKGIQFRDLSHHES